MRDSMLARLNGSSNSQAKRGVARLIKPRQNIPVVLDEEAAALSPVGDQHPLAEPQGDRAATCGQATTAAWSTKYKIFPTRMTINQSQSASVSRSGHRTSL
jgi:hypothetical protein